MPEMTLAQQLADLRLGGNLERFVSTRRDKAVSWRTIAAELHDATGLRLSHEALRSWYGAADRSAA